MPAYLAVDVLPPCVESNLTHYYPLARRAAQRYFWRAADVDDIIQCGMVGLLEAVRSRARRRLPPPDDGAAFAQRIFSMWMPWWYTRQMQDQDPRGEQFQDYHLPVTGWEQYFSQVTVNAYLEEVKKVLGPTAYQIARNLIDPTPECVAEAVRVMETKQALKAQGKRVTGYDTVRVTHQVIRRVLDLGEWTWECALRDLRAFTVEWLACA